jgi:hypothetical protein
MIRPLSRKKVSRVQFKPTWDHFIASRRGNLHAARIDHDLADRAFARLQQFFGDDPMTVPDRVMDYVINCAPHTYEWICWFSGCLDQFADTNGYASLCADLRDNDKHDAAATVLQVADRLHAVGLEIAFDPSVVIDGKKKMPDLLVRDRAANNFFYAEISIMFSAHRRVEASDVFDRLRDLIHSFRDDPVAHGGRILRPIAPSEVEGLIGLVYWEILEVQRARRFREVRFEDSLLLALAPEALKDEVDRWSEAHQFEPGSFGAGMPPVDEFMRLHIKIAEEVQQLPSSQPNVLMIWAQSLLLVSPDPLALLPHIRGIAREHPKVALLVVVFEGYTSARIKHAAAGDCLIAGGTRGGIEFQHIIVPNDACPTPFPPETILKLKSAFALSGI